MPRTITKVKVDLKRPRMFSVIIHDDDVTPIEFVIAVLMQIFNKSEDEAIKLARIADEEGQAVAGRYPKQVAETKKINAMQIASANHLPMKVTIKPD